MLSDLPDLPDLGLGEIQEFLDRQMSGQISFTELMGELLEGDWRQAFSRLFEAVKYSLFTENSSSIRFLAQAAGLGILGAVFSQAAAVFPSSRVADTGFFITYLLTFTCLTAGFFTSVETAANVIDSILGFMRVLLRGGPVQQRSGRCWGRRFPVRDNSSSHG